MAFDSLSRTRFGRTRRQNHSPHGKAEQVMCEATLIASRNSAGQVAPTLRGLVSCDYN